MKIKWQNIDVTILGFSKSGISAAKYLSGKGANCTISERRSPSEPDNLVVKELEKLCIKVEMGEHKEDTILKSDIIISSPGIPPHSDVMKLINKHNILCLSELELAYRETNIPFIAITGTNGKTTTTKLVSEILENYGYKAPACGNIGIPPTSLLNQDDIDYFVAEVSSYQIATSNTFKPQIAAFLNYTPDHIDWHGSEKEYFKAKASLFIDKKPTWAVLNAKDFKIAYLKLEIPSETYFFGREAEDKSVFQKDGVIYLKDRNKKVFEVISVSEIPLKGSHNIENIMAAIAITYIAGVDLNVIRETIKNFSPPEHRLEFVAEVNGIKYFNDSKATNPESTICALKSFNNEKVVLIAGGRDKGTDLKEFVNEVKKNVSAVVLIGEATERFEQALRQNNFNNIHKACSMTDAIKIASEAGERVVLLSPACASFDMFKNFEERGKFFKDYVNKKKQNT